MNKTKIPWCDYTINPVKGLCPMACSYCYARKMYKRFKWNPEIRYEMNYTDLWKIQSGSKVFWGSTMELFGDWVYPDWMSLIFKTVNRHPELTHIFLTKKPENLIKWSPFPNNCWIGVSATNPQMFHEAEVHLGQISASIKFISIEPMLERMWLTNMFYINWLILGSRTQPTRHPQLEWVNEIIKVADRQDIPLFIKEPLASYTNIQRQEFPKLESDIEL